MAGEASSAVPGQPFRLRVDFLLARRLIERLEEYPPAVRSRALATYVGMVDLADDSGMLGRSGVQVAAELQITRMSWLQYREVLEQAGLLRVGRYHGGERRELVLLAPSD